MATEDRYNGWINYATWDVNLWLANDEPMYRDVLQLRGAVARNPDQLAKELEDYVRGVATPEGFGDLTVAELDEVAWPDIAAAWLED